MKKFLLSSVLLTVLALSSQAQALEQRWPQWYIGLSGSLNLLMDSDLSGTGINGEASFNDGYGITGSIGYRPNADYPILNNMRFELEAAYRVNDVDKIRNTTIPARGEAKNVAYMVNAIYDFNNGTQLTPYLGGGAGFSNVEFLDDSDMVFSYQFLAGIGYEPTLIPNTVWSLGYRYFGTVDSNLNRAGVAYDFEYDTHAVEAGLQMKF